MNKKTFIKALSVFLSVVTVISVSAVTTAFAVNIKLDDETPLLTVKYYDVGQADCIFIRLPNDETMLIDAGYSTSSKNPLNYLSNENLDDTGITYVVETHPDYDHIRGFTEILNEYIISSESVFMPAAVSSSNTYTTLMQTINGLKYKVINPSFDSDSNGKYIPYSVVSEPDSNLSVDILAPLQSNSNVNNMSVVVRVQYGESVFLFMGDASYDEEISIIQNYTPEYLDCDVLKCGHHGSSTSSSYEFLSVVKPEYSVISCGKNNSYGHPNESTLTNLSEINSQIYRTDYSGTITATSNGTDITFNKSNNEEPTEDENGAKDFIKWDIDTDTPIIDNAKVAATYTSLAQNQNYLSRGDGHSIKIRSTTAYGTNLSSSGWDSGANVKSWLMRISTLGYYDISLSLHGRTSNAGPRDFRVEYSLNGSSWKSFASFSLKSTLLEDIVFNEEGILNLSVYLPDEAENQNTVYVRFIMDTNVKFDGNSENISQTSCFDINNIAFHGATAPYLSKVTFRNPDGTANSIFRIATGSLVESIEFANTSDSFFMGWNIENNTDDNISQQIECKEILFNFLDENEPQNSAITKDTVFVPIYTGDVNGSGSYDIIDVKKVLAHLAENITLTGNQQLAADFDFENGIDLLDAYLILCHTEQ